MYDFNTENELEVTIAMIGQSKCGKSSMRKLHSGKGLPETPKPSVGIKQFDRLEFYEDFSVRLYIWDLPGREKLKAITSQYIKTADAVLIMYDVTNPKAYLRTEKLIQNVLRLKAGDDYCCVLFGNKIDKQDQRSVSTDKMMKLSLKYDVPLIEGSIKDEMNLDKMFYTLTKQ